MKPIPTKVSLYFIAWFVSFSLMAIVVNAALQYNDGVCELYQAPVYVLKSMKGVARFTCSRQIGLA